MPGRVQSNSEHYTHVLQSTISSREEGLCNGYAESMRQTGKLTSFHTVLLHFAICRNMPPTLSTTLGKYQQWAGQSSWYLCFHMLMTPVEIAARNGINLTAGSSFLLDYHTRRMPKFITYISSHASSSTDFVLTCMFIIG